MIKNRFKKILVALDGSVGSHKALNQGISLARQCNSQLIGLFVIPKGSVLSGEKFHTFRNYQTKLGKKILTKAELTSARNGIDLAKEIIYDDDIREAISKFASFKKCDLIILGARGQSSPKERFLGSTALGVLSISNIPIMVTK